MKTRNQNIEGHELIQLQVGVYQLIFVFEGDVTLSVESAVRFEVGTQKVDWLPEHPELAASLTVLVGQKVERVEDGSEDELRIVFVEGGTLAVSGRAPCGEAYQITSPNGVYIV